MSRISTALALGLILVLVACSEDPLDTPAPQSTAAPAEECGSITQANLRVLASRIVVGDATLNVNSIPATTADEAWFVAGEIEGEGYEAEGDIALWATTTDPEGDDAGLDFTAVNDLAIEGSDWDPDPELTEDDPAVDVLLDCVKDREG